MTSEVDRPPIERMLEEIERGKGTDSTTKSRWEVLCDYALELEHRLESIELDRSTDWMEIASLKKQLADWKELAQEYFIWHSNEALRNSPCKHCWCRVCEKARKMGLEVKNDT